MRAHNACLNVESLIAWSLGQSGDAAMHQTLSCALATGKCKLWSPL